MSRPTRGSDPDRTPPSSERAIPVSIPGFAEWERRHAETDASGERREPESVVRANAEPADLYSRHGRCPGE